VVIAVALGLMMAVPFTLGGCAGGPDHSGVGQPNVSLLAPAQKAITRAVKKDWSNRAPSLMNAARSRLTMARSIVYQAAGKNKKLTDKERQRVNALVKAVKLDVRAAKARSKAIKTRTRVAALAGNKQRSQNQQAQTTNRHTLRPSKSKTHAVPTHEHRKHSRGSRASRHRPKAMGNGKSVQHNTTGPVKSGALGG